MLSTTYPLLGVAVQDSEIQAGLSTHGVRELTGSTAVGSGFAHWYNHEHRHSAIQFVTPAQRHAGLDEALLRNRDEVYQAARAANPGRWSRHTRNWQPVSTVHLNPDKTSSNATAVEKNVLLKKAA